MNLVVRQGDVVLVYRVPARLSAASIAFCALHRNITREGDTPFLQLDLGVIGTGLCSNEALEVADGVLRAALHAHCRVVRAPIRPT